MPNRRILGAGVVLGNPYQRTGQHQADSAGTEKRHLRARCLDGVVRDQPGCDEVKSDQRQTARPCQTFVQGWHHIGHAGRSLDKKAADDGGDDGHRTQCQWIHHTGSTRAGEQQSTQHHGGDQGNGIGFKQVSRHTGAIADVVAHVVGDHGWVARVIFRNTGFDLANQIRTDVSAFGKNAATQTGEDRNQR